MKKAIMAIAAVMVLSLSLLVGCGDTPDSLEGTTWEITSISYSGQSIDPSTMGDARITFKDGMVGPTDSNPENLVAYTYEDGIVIFNDTVFEVNGNTMTASQNGVTVVFTRK